MRYLALIFSAVGVVVFGGLALAGFSWALWVALLAALLTAIGVNDMTQTKHSLRRNYPILANIRFLLEEIRPEIRQYFLESDLDGRPFNRTQRAIVYQRAKGQLDKRPFGTLEDVYASQFEWLSHSIAPAAVQGHDFRVVVGGPDCKQPYSASLLNISAMSFGSLSGAAIRALNKGAKMGGFAHDTGEGSFSVHHAEFGGDIVWDIASGYFGCRNADGTFCEENFAATAANPQIKMIEIKLSQGAKPGHGGVLPAAKVSPEISAARGVPMCQDCVSPARHSAFSTPVEMMRYIARLRDVSGGKPVGFKLCIGYKVEFMALCKAMIETGVTPDFIVIDGKEGGTGAAPLEFTDHLGTPMREGLAFAHNCLVGAGLRDKVRLAASGRIITAFDMVCAMALGADWCNSARGFMFSLGCIQSLSCHTDRCPSGVATQDAQRQKALDVPSKADRVYHVHQNTLMALKELVQAAGLTHPQDITAHHIVRRISDTEVRLLANLILQVEPGALLSGNLEHQHNVFKLYWPMARAERFGL